MKRGYKQTEIGEIPEEWEVTNLGSLCDVVTKGTTPTTMGFSYQNDGINFVKVESITEHGEFLPDFFAHIDDECHESFQRSQLHEKDVLFSIAGAIGRTAIVPKWILPANTNQALAIIRLKKNSQVYPEYIVKTLSSPTIIDQSSMLKGGAAQLNMSLAQVQGLTIPLPPLPEQKKIAEVLSSVDESIRATQAVIEQAKVLKQGMLNQLLTKGIGHKKFKQTEIGEIPEEWEVMTIGEVSEYRRGSFPQPYGLPEWYCADGSKFIQVFDIGSDMRVKEDTQSHISKLAEEKSVFVPKGSLIVSLQGSIGRVAITHYDAYVDRTILIFQKIIKKIDLVFFSYIIQRIFGIEKNSADGGIIKTITVKTLENFNCIIPSLSEQHQIAEKLLAADNFIQLNTSNLENLQTLKSGLMQDLLSGKKRVKV